MRTALVALAVLSLVAPAFGQAPTVTRASGGALTSRLPGPRQSTLERVWVTVHDPLMPVDIRGTAGARTELARRTDGYSYRADYFLDVKEPLSAVEVRFLLFDLWGESMRTLSDVEATDMAGEAEMGGEWSTFGDARPATLYASIAYVARARTKAGRIVEASPATIAAVVAEARKLSPGFDEKRLEPPPPQRTA